MNRLLICWGRSRGGNGAPTYAWLNGRDGHHKGKALGISVRVFSTTCLPFAIGGSLFALDALGTVYIIGI